MQSLPLRTLTALVVALFAAACTHGPPPRGSFPEFVTSTLVGYPDGSFSKGKLRGPTSVEGMPCKAWVRRHANGHLEYIRLAEPWTIAGLLVPAGSEVFFDETQTPKTLGLSEDTLIDGYLCQGGMKIHTGIHPNGRIRFFFSDEDVTIQGIPCRGSVFHPIRFHDNGQLAGCRVTQEVTIDGSTIMPKTTVRLDPEGHLLATD